MKREKSSGLIHSVPSAMHAADLTWGFKTQLILGAGYHSNLWWRLIFIAWSHVMLNSSMGVLFSYSVYSVNVSEWKVKCTGNQRQMHLFLGQLEIQTPGKGEFWILRSALCRGQKPGRCCSIPAVSTWTAAL